VRAQNRERRGAAVRGGQAARAQAGGTAGWSQVRSDVVAAQMGAIGSARPRRMAMAALQAWGCARC
jgi:hypothetical protein